MFGTHLHNIPGLAVSRSNVHVMSASTFHLPNNLGSSLLFVVKQDYL